MICELSKFSKDFDHSIIFSWQSPVQVMAHFPPFLFYFSSFVESFMYLICHLFNIFIKIFFFYFVAYLLTILMPFYNE